VNLAITIASVFAGLALGALVGFRLGRGLGSSRRAFWAMSAAAVVCCGVLNYAGIVLGMRWVAFGALGLMGGLITGMKYGYFESADVWRGGAAGEELESADAPAAEVAAQPDGLERAQLGGESE
jgi:hypothetical protein